MNKYSVLEKAKSRLVIQDPFYATIILDLPMHIDTSVKTAETNGQAIWVNPDFMESLPVDEAVGVLKHEAKHVALLHPWRCGARDPKKWGEAADAIINDILLRQEGNALPEGCIDVPGASQYSVEQYYRMIPDKPKGGGGGQGQGQGQQQGQQQSQGQGQQQGQGQGQGQGQDPLAGDLKRAPDQSEAAQSQAKALVTRARNVAKARGKMPADMEEALSDMLDPKVPWQEVLRRFCHELAEEDESWARPNRRFVAEGIYLPGKYSDESMGEFVAVFDTSGSMDLETEIAQCMSEAAQVVRDLKPKKFVSVYADAVVQHVDEFDDPDEAEVARSFKRYGAGGTNMVEALDYVDEHYPNAAAVVVFTDGYTPFGEPRTYPVLWGITDRNTLDGPDFGEVVHVEFDQG